MDEQKVELIQLHIHQQAEHSDYTSLLKQDICSYDGHEVMKIHRMQMCILKSDLHEIEHIMLYGEHMRI